MKMQIPLPLKFEVSYSLEGFIRNLEQEEVLKYYDASLDIPIHGLYIYGLPKSGKTQLAHLFLSQGIREIACVEDVFKVHDKETVLIDNLLSEVDLFHIMNHILSVQGKILLFTSFVPDDIALPDLRSRLKLLKMIQIKNPSQEFMKILFFKQFGDQQITIHEDVIDFLLTRLQREYLVVHQTVEILSQASIINKRSITIPFVKEVLSL